MLKFLVKSTRRYRKDPRVMLRVCHAISNISFDIAPATSLVNLKTIKYLHSGLKFHKHDGKVVWKCCSAIWNLCRIPNTE